MKLIFFLGAGVSMPSDLPDAKQLTARIFSTPFHDDGTGLFTPGEHTGPGTGSDLTQRVRGLLCLLSKHDTEDIKRVGLYPVAGGFSSSGAIYRGASTYEDLFFLCQEISLWNIGLSDNSLTTPFMEYIERRGAGLLRGASFEARMCDLATLGQQACFFIESVVAETLQQSYRTGFDLIFELARTPGIEQLNIVTLNHDTLVEQFLSTKGVDVVDGFGELDGDVRWWNDEVYDAPNVRVRLFKLHGSVNWYLFQAAGGLRTAISHRADVSAARNRKGEQLTPASRRPSFLSGINKSVSYQRGTYADIHFRFHELLRQCDRMVMSGYGWGDTAISLQLDTWLDRRRGNKLLLLHPRIEELAERSLIMASGHDAWVRSGKLINISSWLCDASLADLNDHLIDSGSNPNP